MSKHCNGRWIPQEECQNCKHDPDCDECPNYVEKCDEWKTCEECAAHTGGCEEYMNGGYQPWNW